MKSSIAFVLLLMIFVFSSPLQAQKTTGPDYKKLSTDEVKKVSTADKIFKDADYLRALSFYSDLLDAHPDDPYFKLRAGICYMYKSDEKEKSITLLKEVEQVAPGTKDIYFYLGRAYHLNQKFDEAIDYFNKYLAQNPPINQQVLTRQYIENSKNGKAFVEIKVKCDIKNVGSVINTEYNEYVPVISSDEAVLIYTYTGPRSTGGLMDSEFNPDPNGYYYEDVFISQRLGDRWLNSQSIGSNINTKNHDANIALSADGQKLFLFHSTEEDGGDIYVSYLEGEVWGVPVRLGPNVNTSSWEGSCSLSADEQTLYFASERPGGFGGKDIYMSKKMPDGSWGVAKNLGPQVNTKYNDDSPFIHPDNKTLFFSSEGHKSVGGYDIMYSTITDTTWSEPTSLGYPINTTEDERFYVLTADGEHGYFSSNRKGGFGGQDIYVVSPGFFGEGPILSLVVGVVSADEKPVKATINVSNAETGEKKASYQSNSATGKYLIALTPGTKYKVAIEVEGQESQIQYVNVKSLDTYVQVQKNFQFYTDEYKKENGIPSVADSANSLQNDINNQIKQNNIEKSPEVYEARVYQDLIKKHGDEVNDTITYNVEMGTFAHASDFDPEPYKDLGNIQSSVDDKGNTTFFFGPFKSLLDAEIFRYKVYGKDKSGWKNPAIVVTINVKGKRKLVQQYYDSEYTRRDYVAPTDTKVIKDKVEYSNPSGEQLSAISSDEGKLEIDGISYKVEVGAVDNPNDFQLQKLSKYGKIESKKYPDGKTRYTMGPFKTLAESEEFKNMLLEKEPDAAKAFVTVVYFGARKTLPEMEEVKKTDAYKKAKTDAIAKRDKKKAEPVKKTEIVKKTEPVKKVEPPAKAESPAKTEPFVVNPTPCDPNAPQDFAFFVGKDLNDKEIYNKLINTAGAMCVEGLTFRVQIGAYRKPQNFKHKNLNSLEPPPALVLPYPDGITRFTMREFNNLKDAEVFRQECIRLGTKDAWITGFYQGKRMLMQELIANNFYNKKIN